MTKRASVIIYGIGGVGRALVRQIVSARPAHLSRYGIDLAVVAVADSTGAVVEPDGLSDDVLLAVERSKANGVPLAETEYGYYATDPIAILDVASADDTIVVDCTATEAVIPALEAAVGRGYGVVLANKKPLTGPLSLFRRLIGSGRVRHEATVGAGTPVIATLNALLRSDDQIQRIEGAFSGTLGYVMTGLQAGRLFSEVVRRAHQQGYTEPDPRDDLGGVDVARKALILARMLGWELELSDVSVEALYPASMATLDVDEFLGRLDELDEAFQSRTRDALERGLVLRYAAEVADGCCVVGPREVPAASPLGRLEGTDNLAAFYTRWYSSQPLVLQGRGAGVDATAAGVLSDIIELAMCVR